MDGEYYSTFDRCQPIRSEPGHSAYLFMMATQSFDSVSRSEASQAILRLGEIVKSPFPIVSADQKRARPFCKDKKDEHTTDDNVSADQKRARPFCSGVPA